MIVKRSWSPWPDGSSCFFSVRESADIYFLQRLQPLLVQLLPEAFARLSWDREGALGFGFRTLRGPPSIATSCCRRYNVAGSLASLLPGSMPSAHICDASAASADV